MSIFLPNSSDKSAELRQKQQNVKEMDKVISGMLRKRSRKSGRRGNSRATPSSGKGSKGVKNTLRELIENEDNKAFNQSVQSQQKMQSRFNDSGFKKLAVRKAKDEIGDGQGSE